jgi:lipoprotein-anchoring transpeptidase ErfK/SrfK
VVPKNLRNINILSLSPFPLHRATDGKKLLLVSIGLQAFGAYDANGQLVHWGPISGGKGYCADIGANCTTVTGNFKILRKQGSACISSKFPVETDGGAPMPYCMHFNGGYALHGSTLPGYNASHGCVRLFFEDAQWLNESWAPIGTRVIVMS